MTKTTTETRLRELERDPNADRETLARAYLRAGSKPHEIRADVYSKWLRLSTLHGALPAPDRDSLGATLTDYLECALWSSTCNGEEISLHYSLERFSDEALAHAWADVQRFLGLADPEHLEELDDGQVGHDLWLTRNGHGAGFWARDYLSPEARESLTQLAESLGGCYAYVSDSDEVEFM